MAGNSFDIEQKLRQAVRQRPPAREPKALDCCGLFLGRNVFNRLDLRREGPTLLTHILGA